jgi:hypothetical protein
MGLLAAILIALSACSGGSPQPAVTVTVVPSTSATTDDGPTIRQFSSIVAILKAKIQKEQDGLQYCPATSKGDRISCGVYANHASFDAVEAEAAMKRVGTPPPHIADLVQQTMTAVDTVVAELPTNPIVLCNQKVSAFCDRYETIQRRNVDELVAILAGWEVYK